MTAEIDNFHQWRLGPIRIYADSEQRPYNGNRRSAATMSATRLCRVILIHLSEPNQFLVIVFWRDPAFSMELFLNLCWLSLLLPGYLLWRKRTSSDRRAAFVFLCTVGCALILLFPVISATDDLHAMRTEMEESGLNKRSVRLTGSEKLGTWAIRLHTPPAVIAASAFLAMPVASLGQTLVEFPSPRTACYAPDAGRAPPFFIG